ncbi:SPT3 Dosage dependent suppressor of Ty-induced promoter mutations-like protein [Blyttiomyces sp. JEL0837]|nr:SPT3 Dosage dependent suppressor of Ty-induced promoter mutations-like protein [Blyttiomyces sp. JEL0837]
MLRGNANVNLPTSPSDAGTDESSNQYSEMTWMLTAPTTTAISTPPYSTTSTSSHTDAFNNTRSSTARSATAEPESPAEALKAALDARVGISWGVQPVETFQILGIPIKNAKSRVETQIKICLQLLSNNQHDTPRWTKLHLAETVASKMRPRQNAIDRAQSVPGETLNLEANVVCASDISKRVTMCPSCRTREVKRYQKKTTTATKLDDAIEDVNSNASPIEPNFEHGIISINAPVLMDFSDGNVILPTRLACYCRHHNENVGFCVYFVGRDNNGTVIATGVTPPIMITDDHKNTGVTKVSKRPRTEDPSTDPIPRQKPSPSMAPTSASLGLDQQIFQILHTPNPTTSPSASTSIAPSVISTATTVFGSPIRNPTPYQPESPPTQPDFTIDTTDDPDPSIHSGSLFSSNANAYSTVEGALGIYDSLMMGLSESPQFATVDSEDAYCEKLAAGIAGAIARSELETPNPSEFDALLAVPIIERVVPHEGPMQGGIEVTILGSNFSPDNKIRFGETTVHVNQCWGTTALICTLPSSPVPGPVSVSVVTTPAVLFNFNADVKSFTYKDDSDRALMELALQVVGLRTTGKIENATKVAMRIINSSGPKGNHSAPPPQHSFAAWSLSETPLNDESKSLEDRIIHALAAVETDPSLSLFPFNVELKASVSKQTLLHLACACGMRSLANYLIRAGADVNVVDVHGMRPLQYALSKNHFSLADELVNAGAITTESRYRHVAFERRKSHDTNAFEDTATPKQQSESMINRFYTQLRDGAGNLRRKASRYIDNRKGHGSFGGDEYVDIEEDNLNVAHDPDELLMVPPDKARQSRDFFLFWLPCIAGLMCLGMIRILLTHQDIALFEGLKQAIPTTVHSFFWAT